MTEGFQGFGEFMQAIQNLEAAAGGGGSSGPVGDGLTPAQRFSNLSDSQRLDEGRPLPAADPGYAWAEDLTQVPIDYWD